MDVMSQKEITNKTLRLRALCFLACLMPMAALPAIYQVGADKAYKTIGSVPTLQPGDTVEIFSGTYNELKKWAISGTPDKPITIKGIGSPRPLIDGTGLNASGSGSVPRALFQVEGNNYIIENLEFKNARNDSYNGAGIRVLNASSTTIRSCKITYCDMGMMSNANDLLVVDSCESAFNGNPEHFNGYGHNFYLEGNRTTVRFCYIHDAIAGLNFKSRGHYTELLYNYIADSNEGEVSLVDSERTKTANSNAVLIGNVIISKSDRTGNAHKFIDFGRDMSGQHNGALYLLNNTLIAGDAQNEFLWASTPVAKITANNNIFYGGDHIVGRPGGGISGSNNWMPKSAVIPPDFKNTVQRASPGFVDLAKRDFHLTAASACRDAGFALSTYVNGSGESVSAAPGWEYTFLHGKTLRVRDKAVDIGAYEYAPPRPEHSTPR